MYHNELINLDTIIRLIVFILEYFIQSPWINEEKEGIYKFAWCCGSFFLSSLTSIVKILFSF